MSKRIYDIGRRSDPRPAEATWRLGLGGKIVLSALAWYLVLMLVPALGTHWVAWAIGVLLNLVFFKADLERALGQPSQGTYLEKPKPQPFTYDLTSDFKDPGKDQGSK